MPPADPAGPELANVVSRLRRAMRRAARAQQATRATSPTPHPPPLPPSPPSAPPPAPAPFTTLSVAQLELLSCLAENPGARPGQLGQLLRLAPSSVTTLVNALRADGLITRVSGPDRRTAQLRLTDAGAAAVRRWHSTNEAIVSAALGSLPAGSRAALRRALPAFRELTAAIDALAGQEPPAAGAAAETGTRRGSAIHPRARR